MTSPSRPPAPATARAADALTPLQRAFIALEETRAELRAMQDAATAPIAIIGVGCRVPGEADDPESFWRLLDERRDATGPLPRDRWDVDALYHPDPEHPGTIAARRGGFLKRVDTFDPAFFGITRREAQGMDPQQRLLLEVCWEALEHAGQAPDRLHRSSTGVYIGVTGSDYAYRQLDTHDPGVLDAHFASGIAHSVASGRVSYLLGLQGPSLTIDTACSSSLVAIHLATQALRSGDCRLALAGGVNLILGPEVYVALSRARMLSPDGRCKTFDASADGFARGEGCGVVVLKRLRDAQADGDRILALVRGSAINQDGASSGLTAPSGPAQEAVIRAALARAGVPPRLVGYLEAHGTGTQLGDPLELRALGAVFAEGRPPESPLVVGSVKTNIGHLEAAAGVAGVIKVVLALQHQQIPAHLHCGQPTAHVSWSDLRLAVAATARTWEPVEGRRLAGVSAFGFSGTNAHVVLEQAPTEQRTTAAITRRRLFVLSAHDERTLRVAAERYAGALSAHDDWSLADVCRSAAARAHHPHRAAIVAGSIDELRAQLAALARGQAVDGVRTGWASGRDPIRVAFLFTGQGAQYPFMGRRLFETEPVFRAAIERCAQILTGELDAPLLEVLYPQEGDASERLHDTEYAQPALFALEYALVSLWRSWGVEPKAVSGHSVGEYVAACVAGVMSLEDALLLVATRGRLMQSLPAGGAMAVVFASVERVAPLIDSQQAVVAVAAINGRAQTVISGAASAVDAICARLAAGGGQSQRLAVSHAYHSPLVEPMLAAFERAAANVRFAPPTLPLVSNLSGRIADASAIANPAYWRAHVRDAVRFADGMRTLASLAPDVCVEVGPHPALLPVVAEAFEDTPAVLVPSLRRLAEDGEVMDEALAALYVAGASIDWTAVWRSSGAGLVDLPPYPFQRERCWFSARPRTTGRGQETGHPLLGVRLHSSLRDIVQFETELRPDAVPILRDHQVGGRLMLPAAAFIEMALAAMRLVSIDGWQLQDVTLGEALVVDAGGSRRTQTIVRLVEGCPTSFEIVSSSTEGDGTDWLRHVNGLYAPLTAAPMVDTSATDALTGTLGTDDHLARLAARGLVFGPSLRGVQRIAVGAGRAVGIVTRVGDEASHAYRLPPALLDACLQVSVAALPPDVAVDAAYLPFAIDAVRSYRSPDDDVTSCVTFRPRHGAAVGTLTGDVTIADARGIVAGIDGITFRAASSSPATGDLYTVVWEALDGDASWTPETRVLAAEVGPRLPALARAQRLGEYHEQFLALERLVPGWIGRALIQRGWRPVVGEAFSADALASALEIVPRYRRLLTRLLEILEEDGALVRRGDAWVVARIPSHEHVVAASAALAEHHPSGHRIELTRRCGSALADILHGDVDPLAQIFPAGSTAAATALYRDAPEAVAYNELIREAVQAIAARLPGGRRLRILEVGGGTGGTTVRVLPILDPTRVSYLFTDRGPSLVSAARDRFGSAGFMEFATLDLEREPASQLGGHRQFDLVLAANVVHATADLRRTLGHLDSLLAPGGTILILEVAGRERWIDVTFGLTDGWWRFTDLDLRPTYPLLARADWVHLLRSVGWEASEIGAELPESRDVLLAARKPMGARRRPGRRWLILADRAGIGRSLAERLTTDGHDTEVVVQSPRGAQAVADVLAARPLDGLDIVHLWSLDLPAAEACERSLIGAQETVLTSLLTIVQALGRASCPSVLTPRLWMATRGAQAVDGGAAVAVMQAPAWGLALGIAREHPEFQATRIDLDPDGSVEAHAEALWRVLGCDTSEDQFAVRQGGVLVARLAPVSPRSESASPDAGVVRRLERTGTGGLDELALVTRLRMRPGPGHIEVEVTAAGLNFRDVMNAVALRDDPEPLGGECAGRVTALGAGVTTLAVGDEVVAMAEASLATHVIADAAHVAPLPRRLTPAEGATVPLAFMTARVALRDCAALRAGETILIHAAAGGVGLAAVRLARSAGATVVATAGSEAKRAFLQAEGVAHVFDSRSLRFEDDVRRVTHGRGVDVVLNAIAGEAIGASVRCLTASGRFVELGKRDIWTADQFAVVRPHGRYFAVDLAALRHEVPAHTAALFQEVVRDLEAGRLQPLPLRAFPFDSAAAAFRFMAQARHVGKIVLVPEGVHRDALARVSGGATYLITGGHTGLGWSAAEQLVDLGARHLVLIGRRRPDEATRAAISRLEVRGVSVRTVAADVSDAAAVRAVVDDIDASMPPLRGVLHAAGALDDVALLQHTWERFVTPLVAKVDGTWALHEATRHLRLDFFVMYSSIVSLLGSPGQANHAAANAFLDAMAWRRRSLGLPAASISWGAWSETGAAAHWQVDGHIQSRGMRMISPDRGRGLLTEALDSGMPHVAAVPVAWDRFIERWGGSNGCRFLDRLAPMVPQPTRVSVSRVGDAGTVDVEALRQATSAQRHATLLAFVGTHVANVIGAPSAQSVAVDQPLHELGVDSLMAVDLRNRLTRGLALPRRLPATLVFEHPTLDALARHLATQVAAPDGAGKAVVAARGSMDAAGAIGQMSDEEIDVLFTQRIAGTQDGSE